uniref:Orf7 n=1 Tax=uncultured bacterium BAC10-10 TaxID=333372 RepID=Q4JIN3_9BACT|nr:Orf7 [uncultured bacterium BAC10-10]
MTGVDAPVVPSGTVRAADLATVAQLACLLEAAAPKPGNVSPGRHFADARYEDFLASAAAIGGPLAGAGARGIGATVRLAVEATARWTSSNTNLGLILLLAPLARAAQVRLHAADAAQPSGEGFTRTLRDAVREVLDTTTVDDARDVYAAIRQAAPGGLGSADAEDVANEPTLPLLDVMALAAHRDGIAREYATAFDTTFEIGAPALARARREGLCWDDAVVETFLVLLAAAPDTHVARRGGAALAEAASTRARDVLAVGGVRSAPGRRALDDMDRALRDPQNSANPGTTADLTAAAIFVALIDGAWPVRPRA